MRVADVPLSVAPVSGWKAELELGFERRADRTVLVRRRHDGPLVVQKALYPEGDEVCHAIIVHPPAGIAGGDALSLRADLGPGARALLTTPGAGKWYRSAGPWASQRLAFNVAAGASLEWLPQETIVFNGALADLGTEIRLQGDASFIGWEILCLGRTGSGETFSRGELKLDLQLWRDGALTWIERGGFAADAKLRNSRAGLDGKAVFGSFAAAGDITDTLLAECRGVSGGAVTRLPGLLVARILCDSGGEARRYFANLWSLIRPALCARAATLPRIWAT